jgi:hypothetical protein
MLTPEEYERFGGGSYRPPRTGALLQLVVNASWPENVAIDIIINDRWPSVIDNNNKIKHELKYENYTGNKEYNDSCTICLEQFIPSDSIYEIKCKHIFHSKCLNLWYKRNKCCPVCRDRIIHVNT